MNDIAPELWELIKSLFLTGVENDADIKEIMRRIAEKTANHVDTQEYAIRIGEHSSNALLGVLKPEVLPDGRMYYNIAEKTVRPAMELDRAMINDVASQIQGILNENASLGMRTIVPAGNDDRIEGIMNRLASEKNVENVRWLFGAPIKAYAQSIVDDFIHENADFQMRSGLEPKIIRTLRGKGCKWCRSLVGVYDYDDVKSTGNDVFRRHDNCRCLVTYDPADGRRIQNVHTKKELNDSDATNQRIGLLIDEVKSIPQRIADFPAILGTMEPEKWREEFKKAGFDVKNLSQGSRRGLDFLEQNGGYKINFGEDGLFMYHPPEKSHHSGEYYKLSFGELGGKRRYDRNGNRIEYRYNPEEGE